MTQARRPDWEQFYAQPEATRSSKPESVAAEIQKKRDKQSEKAHRNAFGGVINSICVLDVRGQALFTMQAGTVAEADALACGFVSFVNSLPDPLGLSPLPEAIDCRVKWFGFDIREVMHMLAMTALAADPNLHVPVGMWYYRNFTPAPFIDPYDVLVTSGLREDVDVYACCERMLGQRPPSGFLDTAANAAEVARRLTLRARLFPYT